MGDHSRNRDVKPIREVETDTLNPFEMLLKYNGEILL